ncbi:hypothetical protein OGAPHI_005678 [Ogataea philodendri]|uniref:Pre-mRNA-splicing factor SLT11 n=1 Tax=Ogataea philodendri TaxID=1378263 RepID=A0A9P8P029_9ASCO|nr:uncharacterized protein OGAPHI_005678 [Ogataea philodendri]KAH3662426.1 hypothetical protein OGAPHI_005678 [Ogataea philodendri]
MSYNDDETPAVCEACLGSNPYIEMSREKKGAECKLCTRPFTVFRWSVKKGDRFKKTLCCLTCARAKNCCQSCMLDLTFGIDLRTRDQLLKLTEQSNVLDLGPANQMSKIYAATQLEKKFKSGGQDSIESVEQKRQNAYKMLDSLSNAVKNKKIAKETEPEDEKVSKEELIKLCKHLPFNGTLDPPKSSKIKSFFLFGFGEKLAEYRVQSYFEDLLGDKKVDAVSLNHRGRFGFVEFSSRTVAERAATLLADGPKTPRLVVIDTDALRVCWAGKSTTPSFSISEAAQVRTIVKRQMIKYAGKEQQGHKRVHDTAEQPEPKKQKPETKPSKYSSLGQDLEI